MATAITCRARLQIVFVHSASNKTTAFGFVDSIRFLCECCCVSAVRLGAITFIGVTQRQKQLTALGKKKNGEEKLYEEEW